MEALPLLTSGCCAAATGVSADGSLIVGYCEQPASLVACRWTSAAIETLPGQEPAERASIVHDNVRGPDYYH